MTEYRRGDHVRHRSGSVGRVQAVQEPDGALYVEVHMPHTTRELFRTYWGPERVTRWYREGDRVEHTNSHRRGVVRETITWRDGTQELRVELEPDPVDGKVTDTQWSSAHVDLARETDDPRPERLCYVEGCRAYFTTQRLSDQRGDDWDDAPYEHNAGKPYAYRLPEPGTRLRAGPIADPWEIRTVMFWADLFTPDQLTDSVNSPYSVDAINKRQVAWLSRMELGDPQPGRRGLVTRPWVPRPVVYAGVSIDEFARLIEAEGGSVYLPRRGGPFAECLSLLREVFKGYGASNDVSTRAGSFLRRWL